MKTQTSIITACAHLPAEPLFAAKVNSPRIVNLRGCKHSVWGCVSLAYSAVSPIVPHTMIVRRPKRPRTNQERIVPTNPMPTDPRLNENESSALTPACCKKYTN